jgi:type VI secretion system protein ImpJ
MKQLQPVLWTKGTFLTPQHFQLQERFLEDSLNFRLQALKFCAWGFSEIVLDQELLTEGQLAVSRASGIFPDGLLFEIPGSDQPPPSKALAEFFDPGVRDLDIYLTVPDYKQKGLNVAGLGRTAGSRYVAEITSARDDNTGSGERPIQIARKNLRLLAANETREGSSALRIANVERTEAGAFRLNPRPANICAVWSAEFLKSFPPRVPSSRAAVARRIRAWPTSPRRTSPASGCCIPSTRISLCSAICCRASAATPRSFSLN